MGTKTKIFLFGFFCFTIQLITPYLLVSLPTGEEAPAPGGPLKQTGTCFQSVSLPDTSTQTYILSAWVCPGTGAASIGFMSTTSDNTNVSYDGVKVSSNSTILTFGTEGNLYQDANAIRNFSSQHPDFSKPFTWHHLYVTFSYASNPLVASKTYILLRNRSPQNASYSVWFDGVQLEKAVLPDQKLPTTYSPGKKIISPTQEPDSSGQKLYSEW